MADTKGGVGARPCRGREAGSPGQGHKQSGPGLQAQSYPWEEPTVARVSHWSEPSAKGVTGPAPRSQSAARVLAETAESSQPQCPHHQGTLPTLKDSISNKNILQNSQFLEGGTMTGPGAQGQLTCPKGMAGGGGGDSRWQPDQQDEERNASEVCSACALFHIFGLNPHYNLEKGVLLSLFHREGKGDSEQLDQVKLGAVSERGVLATPAARCRPLPTTQRSSPNTSDRG